MNYLQQLVVQQARLQQILSQMAGFLSESTSFQPPLVQENSALFTALQAQITALEQTVQAIASAASFTSAIAHPVVGLADWQANSLAATTLLQPPVDLLDQGFDGLLMLDRDWRIVYLNARAEELLQRTAVDLLGREFWAEFPAAISLACYREYHRVMQEQMPTVFEEYYPPLDTWFEVRAYPIPEGIACYFLDISDRKRAEADLRASEARLRLILEHMPVMLNAVDESGRFVMWNQELERVTGYSKAEILGQPEGLALLYPTEQLEAMLARWAETGGDFRNWEIPIAIKDGSQKIISWSNLSRQFPIEGWMSWAVGIDVTERVVAEQERQAAIAALSQLNQELEMRVQQRTQELEQSQKVLRQQQQQFRSLVENIPDIVARMDRQLRHLYINSSVERTTGIPAARFIGKTFRQMGFSRAGIARVEPLLQLAFETGEMQSQMIELTPYQQVFEITVVPERSAIGNVETILVIWRDVTQLKQAERSLQEKEQQFRTLAENAPDIILRFDRHCRHRYVNPRFEAITGISAAAALGKTSLELGFPAETARRWDEVSQTVFETGLACMVESEILTAEGRQTFHSLVVPEIDQTGAVASVMVVARDITSRKQAEADLLYAIERLEQLNRLKDDFLSTVSHELRTPVSNIRVSVRMLELAIKQASLPPAQQAKIKQYLQVLNQECEREIRLINDLLDLQRLETGQQTAVIEAIELQPWLERLVQPFQERTHTRQQTIETIMTDLPSPFLCDLTSLERILAELLNNACKYTPPGERIVLQVSACPEAVEFCLTNYGVEIPPNHLARIFEKFYRIPSADPWKQGGTGLGLALIQKLADYMQGSIAVESANQRTRFRLRLPYRDRLSF